MKANKYKNNGFTLIEIIVTIVILAVLMAVSVPTILNYIDEADQASSLANAHAFYTSVQAIAVKEYANGNAYSNSSSGPKLTYEAVTNTRPRPSDEPDSERIQKIYDLMSVESIHRKFESIAIVDKGIITIMRYKDLESKKIYEWKQDSQVWTQLKNITDDTPWAGEILPDSYPDKSIWWNGYAP